MLPFAYQALAFNVEVGTIIMSLAFSMAFFFIVVIYFEGIKIVRIKRKYFKDAKNIFNVILIILFTTYFGFRVIGNPRYYP